MVRWECKKDGEGTKRAWGFRARVLEMKGSRRRTLGHRRYRILLTTGLPLPTYFVSTMARLRLFLEQKSSSSGLITYKEQSTEQAIREGFH